MQPTEKQDLPPLDPGVYPNMLADEYHRHAGVTHSFLVQCCRSLAHGDAYRRNGRKATDDMRFGKAYHTLILEPEVFATKYHIWSGKPRNKLVENGGGKEEYTDLLAKVKDPDLLVSLPDLKAMQQMAEKLRRAKERRDVLDAPGKYEYVIAWTDPLTGLPCRAMLDKFVEPFGTVLDLKKARSAEAFWFGSAAAKYGYDIEAAFYTDGAREAGLGNLDFMFLAQEDEDPYESALYAVEGREMEAGRRKYRPLMPLIAKACKTGVWPGLPDHIQSLTMPKHAYPDAPIDGDEPQTMTWDNPDPAEVAAANEEF